MAHMDEDGFQLQGSKKTLIYRMLLYCLKN